MRHECRQVASRSLLLVVVLTGCQDGSADLARPDTTAPQRVDASTPGPAIAIVDSLVLQEATDTPLGGFTSFWGVTRSGHVVVSDITNQRVAVFDPDGRFVHALGGRGGGPGEFEAPGAVLTDVAEGQVAVLDLNRSRMLLFDVVTGAFVREIITPFQHIGLSAAWVGSGVVVAPVRGSAPLVRWSFTDDSFEPFGAAGNEFIPGSQSVIMAAGIPGVAHHASGWLLWEPGYGLSLRDAQGSVLRTLAIPVARRRGEGATVVSRQMELSRDPSMPVVLSAALGIGMLADSTILLASSDHDLVGEDARSARPTNLRVYLTVLDPSMQRACLDGLLPLDSDVPVAPIFRDDTIQVLTRVVSDEGTVRSVVYTLGIELGGCEWIPLEGPTP